MNGYKRLTRQFSLTLRDLPAHDDQFFKPFDHYGAAEAAMPEDCVTMACRFMERE